MKWKDYTFVFNKDHNTVIINELGCAHFYNGLEMNDGSLHLADSFGSVKHV